MAHWLLFTSPVCATTGWACTTGCTPRGHPLTFRSIPIDADAPEYASHEGRMAFPERRRRHWHQRLLTPVREDDQAGEAAAPPGRPHEQHQDPGGGVPLDEGREGGQRQACLRPTNPAACASRSAETSMTAPQTPMTQCTLNAMIATMRCRNCVPPFALSCDGAPWSGHLAGSRFCIPICKRCHLCSNRAGT